MSMKPGKKDTSKQISCSSEDGIYFRNFHPNALFVALVDGIRTDI